MREYNILLDTLPETVTVNGEEYPIDTNFRTGILFEQIVTDNSIESRNKAATILVMYYGRNIPPDKVEALKAITKFWRCGNEPKENRETTTRSAIGKRRMDRIYDFDVDAALFYAAFLAQYRIDLNDVDYLHWWKFMAMFEGLRRDNEIRRVMEIRATDISTVDNKKEKQRIMRLQELYRIDAELTAEDKAEIAGAVFGG